MSQHDYVIDNQDGASFRGDINQVLAAVVSNNSGATEPSTTFAYMWWADTTAGLIKQRNATKDGWITVATIGKTLTPTDSKALAKAWVNFNGTGTVAIRESYGVSSITDVSVGRYAVNFTSAMASANYCPVLGWAHGASTYGGGEFEIGNVSIFDRSAASLTVQAKNDGASATDIFDVNVAVFQ